MAATASHGAIAGRQQPLVEDENQTYADVLPESPGLERFEFDNSFSIPVVHGAWQKGRGRGYRWQDGRWQQFWETQPLDALFGACPMVDDYDGDGKPELVIRPWYELVSSTRPRARSRTAAALPRGGATDYTPPMT